MTIGVAQLDESTGVSIPLAHIDCSACLTGSRNPNGIIRRFKKIGSPDTFKAIFGIFIPPVASDDFKINRFNSPSSVEETNKVISA